MSKKLVSTEEYTRLLNEHLAKHEKGAGLPPFTNAGTGFNWPRNIETDGIYQNVSAEVQKLYRPPAKGEKV